ncbi:MAG: hypothetical protein KJ559_02685 [Nanoarchaeota archaeon]|nr:hypothetical protein [Nanoarchaeota archaeon]
MQEKHEDRLLFLKEFAKELIIKSKVPSLSEKKQEPTQLIQPILQYPRETEAKSVQINPIRVKEYKELKKPEVQKENMLGEIGVLIKDPRVTIIECPGPDKFVLAKTSGRTLITRIKLNAEEIQKIIKQFSEEAKIPVISGLFKANIRNLSITAVISEMIGSRFIITKMTPRFMLEQIENRQNN